MLLRSLSECRVRPLQRSEAANKSKDQGLDEEDDVGGEDRPNGADRTIRGIIGSHEETFHRYFSSIESTYANVLKIL